MSSFAPIGSQEHLSNDSFWPSFTDIMMVVVMIFLFATSILIVRNFHLVAELQVSLEAEKQAEQVIETTSIANATLEQRLNKVEHEIANATQENATLEERLTNYEHENSLLRLQVLATREKLERSNFKNSQDTLLITKLSQQTAAMSASIKLKDIQIADNSTSIQNLNQKNIQLNTELTTVQSQLTTQVNRTEQLTTSNANLSSQLATLQINYDDTSDELNKLEEESLSSASTITLLQEEKEQYNQEILSLKGDYEIVRAKYQKLIKPARSAKGKYIAEVHYIKSANKDLIRFKEPADSDYSELSLKQVEAKLDKLKKKYGSELYVKIIIPKNSGLTYNEAWSFMKGILDKYDYYYQK